MTRAELRFLAEEIHRRMAEASREESETYFNTMEAAEFLGMSLSFVKKHIGEIPHTKVGRLNKFKKSSLMAYRSRC